jgi:hypothetical protein
VGAIDETGMSLFSYVGTAEEAWPMIKANEFAGIQQELAKEK